MQPRIFCPVIILLLCISCKKDNSPDTSPNGISDNNNCKACIYIPMCDSSIYTYYDTLGGNFKTLTDTFLYKKDTLLRGHVYEKFYSTYNHDFFYSNCTNGISRYGEEDGLSDSTILHRISLDANLPVNGTWSDTVKQQLLLVDPIQKNTVLSKGMSRTVNGLVFNDVVHVRKERGYVQMGSFTLYNTVDYYYARGVGLIDAILTTHPSLIVAQHRAVKSYYIP
ncbi:MAG: hypothetical protein V4722_22940 [Bacteroidota bacterium]